MKYPLSWLLQLVSSKSNQRLYSPAHPPASKVKKILGEKRPGPGVEAALGLNPEFFSGLDETQSPRLDAGIVFEYYRWETAEHHPLYHPER